MDLKKFAKGLKEHVETPVKLPKPTPSRPVEAIKKIAIDTLDGKVFTDRHLGPQSSLLFNVFMPILFMDRKQRLQMQADGPGLIFEYLDSKGVAPRSINGFPIFMSMQYLTTAEAELFWKFYEEEKQKRPKPEPEPK